MDTLATSTTGVMTLQQFLMFSQTLPTDIRYQLLNGVPIQMNSPSEKHQDICSEFFGTLFLYFRNKKCKPSFNRDVILNESKNTLYIPDALVVCDPSIDDGQYIHGAPTLVMEVWSPFSSLIERKRKRHDYPQSGVKEFWEFDVPNELSLRHNLSDDGTISISVFSFDKPMPSLYFDGLIFNMERFSTPLD